MLGPRGVDQLVDLLLNATGLGGGGNLSLHDLGHLTVDVAALGNLTLALDALNLDGLDTVREIQLLDPPPNVTGHAPPDPATLSTGIELGRVGVELALSLGLAPATSLDGLGGDGLGPAAAAAPPPQPPPAKLALRAAVTNLSLHTSGLLVVNGSGLAQLFSIFSLRSPRF